MTTRTHPTRFIQGRLALVPALIITALLVGACAGGGNDNGTEPASANGASAELGPPEGGDVDAPAVDEEAAAADGLTDSAFARRTSANKAGSDETATPALRTRAVISTGTVTLQSRDVAQARFDVEKVIAEYRGEIGDEQTGTDPKGEVQRSRLVIRVPSEYFDEAMDALSEVADLRSAKRTSEDVTTEVIDTDVRVRAQEKSLQRVEQLLARARNLRDIIWIESQLNQRQAELDSLKSQQAWLADQTTLSTITVFLERKPDPAKKKAKDDEDGFVAGLERGWDGLTTAATAVATFAGTVLPFTVLLLILGAPLWLLLRNLLRRRQPGPVPAE